MQIKYLNQTCWACPEQYEWETECGKSIYIRCRYWRRRLELDWEVIAAGHSENDGTFGEWELDRILYKYLINLQSEDMNTEQEYIDTIEALEDIGYTSWEYDNYYREKCIIVVYPENKTYSTQDQDKYTAL